ncbi:hypothetical protein N431DRAFT_462006 [Stipitochalara longipes BDJ]|nr:hypothetical protein N431DRAFT_462006 [Stipitochalara longipes BDJ]
MVAIQAVLTIVMAVMATAALAGSVNANLRFFRIDDSVCNSQNPGVQVDQVTIFNPPLTAGQLGINTCIHIVLRDLSLLISLDMDVFWTNFPIPTALSQARWALRIMHVFKASVWTLSTRLLATEHLPTVRW